MRKPTHTNDHFKSFNCRWDKKETERGKQIYLGFEFEQNKFKGANGYF